MTPGKKYPLRKSRFGKLDSFEFGVTRGINYTSVLSSEQNSNLEKILKELRQKMDFPYKRSILAELLKEMGVIYKIQGRDRILYEREDIIAWRERYLRKMMETRKSVSPKNTVYKDETWSSYKKGVD